MSFRNSLLFIVMLMVADLAVAQDREHVRWKFSAIKEEGQVWKIVFTSTIDAGWHLYSQRIPKGGPMPTTIEFEKSNDVVLVGKPKELGSLRRGYDDTFMMNVSWFEDQVRFEQRARVKHAGVVQGEVIYSVCSKEMCVPGSVKFSIEVGK
jgi:DsbC/DsbD-like thiol-disulfide interchange protein